MHLIAVAIALVLSALPGDVPAAPQLAEPQLAPPQGLALLGASATAGWGVIVPAQIPSEGNRFHHVDLEKALQAVAPDLPDAVTSSGDAFFFRRSLATRAGQVDVVIASRPEAVIALDFLFWYGHGSIWPRDGQTKGDLRMDRLNKGLAQLDKLVATGVPIVVGDLPDVSSALRATFSVLTPGQVPKADVRTAMNDRIHTWAKASPSVHLIPLFSLMASMQSKSPISAGGTTWGPEPRLMLHDQLHPSSEGLLAIASVIADTLHKINDVDAEPVDKAKARTRLQTRSKPVEAAPTP